MKHEKERTNDSNPDLTKEDAQQGEVQEGLSSIAIREHTIWERQQ